MERIFADAVGRNVTAARVRYPLAYPEKFKQEDVAKRRRDRYAQAQPHPFVRKHYGC